MGSLVLCPVRRGRDKGICTAGVQGAISIPKCHGPPDSFLCVVIQDFLSCWSSPLPCLRQGLFIVVYPRYARWPRASWDLLFLPLVSLLMRALVLQIQCTSFLNFCKLRSSLWRASKLFTHTVSPQDGGFLCINLTESDVQIFNQILSWVFLMVFSNKINILISRLSRANCSPWYGGIYPNIWKP